LPALGLASPLLALAAASRSMDAMSPQRTARPSRFRHAKACRNRGKIIRRRGIGERNWGCSWCVEHASGSRCASNRCSATVARVIARGYFNEFARPFLRGRRPVPPSPSTPPVSQVTGGTPKREMHSCAMDVQLLRNDCDSTNTPLYLISPSTLYPWKAFRF
jgi:hypothetical protein